MTTPTPEQLLQPTAETLSLFAVTPPSESRLAQLHAEYADAKAAADAAAERLKTITDGIKAELQAAAANGSPGTDRIELRSPYGPTLRLVRSVRQIFDSRRFRSAIVASGNVELQHMYDEFTKTSESWSMREAS